jgi:hypothetical protein
LNRPCVAKKGDLFSDRLPAAAYSQMTEVDVKEFVAIHDAFAQGSIGQDACVASLNVVLVRVSTRPCEVELEGELFSDSVLIFSFVDPIMVKADLLLAEAESLLAEGDQVCLWKAAFLMLL